MTTDQLITCSVILLLICFVVFWMGYLLGQNHGKELGYQQGCVDEQFRTKGRILNAKFKGAKMVMELYRSQGRPVGAILADWVHRSFSNYRQPDSYEN